MYFVILLREIGEVLLLTGVNQHAHREVLRYLRSRGSRIGTALSFHYLNTSITVRQSQSD